MLHIIRREAELSGSQVSSEIRNSTQRNRGAASTHPRSAEGLRFGSRGAAFLPRHLGATWSQLGPPRFYPCDERSGLSSPVGISRAGTRCGFALCIFHSLSSARLGTICKGKNNA